MKESLARIVSSALRGRSGAPIIIVIDELTGAAHYAVKQLSGEMSTLRCAGAGFQLGRMVSSLATPSRVTDRLRRRRTCAPHFMTENTARGADAPYAGALLTRAAGSKMTLRVHVLRRRGAGVLRHRWRASWRST
jgi:hypothetical protein